MEEEERMLWNKSGVANIIFLGELFKVGLLPPKLLLGCVEMLLQKTTEGLQSKLVDGPKPSTLLELPPLSFVLPNGPDLT